MEFRDGAIQWVVQQNRSDAGIGHLRFWFEQVSAAEKGLVLFDRLPFVVINGAALADPPGVDVAQTGDAPVIAFQRPGPYVASGNWNVVSAQGGKARLVRRL